MWGTQLFFSHKTTHRYTAPKQSPVSRRSWQISKRHTETCYVWVPLPQWKSWEAALLSNSTTESNLLCHRSINKLKNSQYKQHKHLYFTCRCWPDARTCGSQRMRENGRQSCWSRVSPPSDSRNKANVNTEASMTPDQTDSAAIEESMCLTRLYLALSKWHAFRDFFELSILHHTKAKLLYKYVICSGAQNGTLNTPTSHCDWSRGVAQFKPHLPRRSCPSSVHGIRRAGWPGCRSFSFDQ